jgi:hypothetical protein
MWIRIRDLFDSGFGSGIRDKHPGSATLLLSTVHNVQYFFVIFTSTVEHFLWRGVWGWGRGRGGVERKKVVVQNFN